MTELERRLARVRVILGLMPSEGDWEGRATYLAYLIASGSPEEHIEKACEMLERARPGWLEHVERYAHDMEGIELALTPIPATQEAPE